jgi:glucokinase
VGLLRWRPGAPRGRLEDGETAIALLLGIDVGGTKTAFSLGDGMGRIHARERVPTPNTGDARRDLELIAEHARALVAGSGSALHDVAAVGVSVPGGVDFDAGLVLAPPNLPSWDRLPLRDGLGAALGRPVAIENDANAAALAEWRFGAGRGARNLVLLTMSTGVGGGLILGGRLHRGVLSAAGEVGHIPVEWDGAPCACGQRGCLEAYVGGAAWTKWLRRETPAGSRVAALAGAPDAIRPEHVVAAAREGDAFALAELTRWNGYLVRGLAALVATLAPELIILGTIATAAGEALCFEPVRLELAKRVWPYLAGRIRVEPAALGAELPYHAGLGVARELVG